MQLKQIIRKVSGLQAPVRTLQAELKKAKPVEEAWDPAACQMAGAEYPFISSVKNQQIDGLWLCHCGTENHLTHITGKYPFGHLKCRRCSHIFCDDCRTSEILTRIPAEATEIFRPRFHQSNEMAYCSVCQHCGLSHRATMSGGCLDFTVTSCADCRHPLKPGNTGYYIGSIVGFRRDPEGTAVALKLQWNLGKSVAPESSTGVAKPPSVPKLTRMPPLPPKLIDTPPPLPVLTTKPVRVHTAAPVSTVKPARAQHRTTEPIRPSAPSRATPSSRPSHGVDLSEEDLERRLQARRVQAQAQTEAPHRPAPQIRSQTVADLSNRVILQSAPSTGFKDMDEVMARLRSIPGYRVVA